MVRTRGKLLMLCYFYPPMHNSGAERSAKFVKYLPEYGWSPVVVTPGVRGAGPGGFGQEKVVRVPNVLWKVLWKLIRRLRRTGGPEGSDQKGQTACVRPIAALGRRLAKSLDRFIDAWVLVPDWAITWAVLAFWPSWRLLQRRDADVIYTTSPPASSHLLGLALKKVTGRPWVMDLRDPWTIEPYNEALRRSLLRLSVEERLERWCFGASDAIIANTPEVERRYRTLYPACENKIQTIPNGFDGEEIARAVTDLDRPSPWRDLAKATFVISHAGAFFRYKRGDQIPHALLDALKSLLDERVLSPENCRVVFVGATNPAILDRIAELGLERLIDVPGVVSHFDSLRLMLLSDLLLLFDPDGDGKTYVRSKLYEYLGSGKTILGMVPDGASRELLERSGRGLLASPDDAEGIKRALMEALGGYAPQPAADFDLEAYERKNLTGQLVSLLNGSSA